MNNNFKGHQSELDGLSTNIIIKQKAKIKQLEEQIQKLKQDIENLKFNFISTERYNQNADFNTGKFDY